jgi:hypothetical protein
LLEPEVDSPTTAGDMPPDTASTKLIARNSLTSAWSEKVCADEKRLEAAKVKAEQLLGGARRVSASERKRQQKAAKATTELISRKSLTSSWEMRVDKQETQATFFFEERAAIQIATAALKVIEADLETRIEKIKQTQLSVIKEAQKKLEADRLDLEMSVKLREKEASWTQEESKLKAAMKDIIAARGKSTGKAFKVAEAALQRAVMAKEVECCVLHKQKEDELVVRLERAEMKLSSELQAVSNESLQTNEEVMEKHVDTIGNLAKIEVRRLSDAEQKEAIRAAAAALVAMEQEMKATVERKQILQQSVLEDTRKQLQIEQLELDTTAKLLEKERQLEQDKTKLEEARKSGAVTNVASAATAALEEAVKAQEVEREALVKQKEEEVAARAERERRAQQLELEVSMKAAEETVRREREFEYFKAEAAEHVVAARRWEAEKIQLEAKANEALKSSALQVAGMHAKEKALEAEFDAKVVAYTSTLATQEAVHSKALVGLRQNYEGEVQEHRDTMVVVEQASVSKDEDLYRLREAMRRAVAEKAAGETVSKAKDEAHAVTFANLSKTKETMCKTVAEKTAAEVLYKASASTALKMKDEAHAEALANLAKMKDAMYRTMAQKTAAEALYRASASVYVRKTNDENQRAERQVVAQKKFEQDKTPNRVEKERADPRSMTTAEGLLRKAFATQFAWVTIGVGMSNLAEKQAAASKAEEKGKQALKHEQAQLYQTHCGVSIGPVPMEDRIRRSKILTDYSQPHDDSGGSEGGVLRNGYNSGEDGGVALQAKEELATALKARERVHATEMEAQLTRLQCEMADSVERTRAKQAAAAEVIRQRHEQELKAVQQEHAETLKLKAGDHHAVIDAATKAAKAEHAATLSDMQEQQHARYAETEARLIDAHEEKMRVTQQEVRLEMEKESDAKLVALQNTHEAAAKANEEAHAALLHCKETEHIAARGEVQKRSDAAAEEARQLFEATEEIIKDLEREKEELEARESAALQAKEELATALKAREDKTIEHRIEVLERENAELKVRGGEAMKTNEKLVSEASARETIYRQILKVKDEAYAAAIYQRDEADGDDFLAGAAAALTSAVAAEKRDLENKLEHLQAHLKQQAEESRMWQKRAAQLVELVTTNKTSVASADARVEDTTAAAETQAEELTDVLSEAENRAKEERNLRERSQATLELLYLEDSQSASKFAELKLSLETRVQELEDSLGVQMRLLQAKEAGLRAQTELTNRTEAEKVIWQQRAEKLKRNSRVGLAALLVE